MNDGILESYEVSINSDSGYYAVVTSKWRVPHPLADRETPLPLVRVPKSMIITKETKCVTPEDLLNLTESYNAQIGGEVFHVMLKHMGER